MTIGRVCRIISSTINCTKSNKEDKYKTTLVDFVFRFLNFCLIVWGERGRESYYYGYCAAADYASRCGSSVLVVFRVKEAMISSDHCNNARIVQICSGNLPIPSDKARIYISGKKLY